MPGFELAKVAAEIVARSEDEVQHVAVGETLLSSPLVLLAVRRVGSGLPF